jgi:hypothetical protein
LRLARGSAAARQAHAGDAARFGRSHKLENQYEVLSDAVVNTVDSMLQSAEVQNALTAP